MDAMWRAIIWQQFGAAIDMLDNALVACPDELWRSRLWRDGSQESEFSEFWYVGYHALFWLDLYLSGSEEGFAPPAPFSLESLRGVDRPPQLTIGSPGVELDPAGLLAERPYTKDELRAYLEHGRKKCRATIETLTEEKARQRCAFSWGEVTFLELLLYNMRHVQEHAAQLSLALGQKSVSAPDWVTKAKSNNSDE